LPLALLEYGAMGLAVVATAVGQVSDVLDGGRAGVLVPPGDHRELAKALVSLLRSPEDRERLGRNLGARVTATFDTRAAVEGLHSLYTTALAGSSRVGHLAGLAASAE
jgi:glycosyltransferase involved in cell wall biosynthesis